jgi:hypothetical protein
MNKLFDEFDAAATYARQCAASEQSVVSLHPTEDQWAVGPIDALPSEFARPIRKEEMVSEDEIIGTFLEYESANDDHSALQAV